MAKDKKSIEPQSLQEEVAKHFLVAAPWDSAPRAVKAQCRIRARALLEYLDSQGTRLPNDTRLIRTQE